mmetsp:Transcript_36106/g.69525  ORF Transcript_36106/g.69525 Transcript_36106/m.69525 type:complete len:352 (-) Transcript_36106:130-1185(-)
MAPPLAHGAQAWTRRDAAVEDEVLRCGYFADVAFKFHTGIGREPEEVYGQRALFALLSPVLRQRLMPMQGCSPSGACEGCAPHGRCEVWLDNGVTARGFREVARYSYGLQPRFTATALPEILYAARILDLEELWKAAVTWGLAELGEKAAKQSAEMSESDRDTPVDSKEISADDGLEIALKCFETLCLFEPVPLEQVVCWSEALFQAYTPLDIFSCSAFFTLAPFAVEQLFEEEPMHMDPGMLWIASLHWAYRYAELHPPETPAPEDPVPTRLFGPGCKISDILSKPPPSDGEVAWQRRLLPLAARIDFSQMGPPEFAKNIDALDPILPELRQAVYATRRRGTRGHMRRCA